jgi:hypothetical protein
VSPFAPRPCLCGCGRTFRRPRSIALCKAGTARAYELMRAIPLLDEFNAESRRSYRFWSSEVTVAAALAADRAPVAAGA